MISHVPNVVDHPTGINMFYNKRKNLFLAALLGLLFAILLAPHPDTSMVAVAPTQVTLDPSTLNPQALVYSPPVSDADWCKNRIAQAKAKVEAHQHEQDTKYWQYYTGVLHACSSNPRRIPHAPTHRKTHNNLNPFSGSSASSFRYD